MSQIFHESTLYAVLPNQKVEYEAKINDVKIISVEYEPGAVPETMQAVVEVSIYDIGAPQTPIAPGKTWEQGGNIVYENVGDINPSSVQMFPISNGDTFEIKLSIAGVEVYQREVESVAISNYGSVVLNIHVHDVEEDE